MIRIGLPLLLPFAMIFPSPGTNQLSVVQPTHGSHTFSDSYPDVPLMGVELLALFEKMNGIAGNDHQTKLVKRSQLPATSSAPPILPSSGFRSRRLIGQPSGSDESMIGKTS